MERIYVINLDRKADRWRGIQAELRRMKGCERSSSVRRDSPVLGGGRTVPRPSSEPGPDRPDVHARRATLRATGYEDRHGCRDPSANSDDVASRGGGCSVAHWGVAARRRGRRRLHPGAGGRRFFARSFGRDMSAAWAEVVASTPIKLEPAGSSAPYAQPGSPFDLLYVSGKQVRDACLDQGTMQHVFVPRAGLWQLSGYVLSKPGAQRLLASLPVRGPVDMWINHQFDGLQVLATRRSIVGQRRAASVPGVDQTSSVTRTVSGARTGARTPPTSVSAPRHRLDHREDRIRRRPLSLIAAIPAPDTGDRTGDLWTELQVRRFRTTARSCRAGRVP